MCRTTEHNQHNLSGCVGLLLSWAYHHIPLLRMDGFETCQFPLVERWVEYRPDNARGESRLRHYRCTLNGIGILNVDWTLYTDPQLHGLVPLGIAKAEALMAIECLLICFTIVKWHKWAHIELFGQGNKNLVVGGVVLDDLPMHHPDAPDLYQPEDGDPPKVQPAAGGGRGRGWGRSRGKGRHGGRRGRQGDPEVARNRDSVSSPGHVVEDIGHTVRDLSGPFSGDYLSLRPPWLDPSDPGPNHQGHTPRSGPSAHLDIQFNLPFNTSDFGPQPDYEPMLDTQDMVDVTMDMPD
ncbi:hypothetical protein Ahy_B02g059498 [Arachis hypogaea]|uniref:Aminotransferase-like plant mobile domain-containing protein n=1 Tax=Arachis hypogaea TaxID=3818 RepID=A0A445AGT1_ARAHY|nr:hypothetical protein Ahy_B02g059498 [Arachis hypogaea]